MLVESKLIKKIEDVKYLFFFYELIFTEFWEI